ncbi:MAG: helix-turn-helix domain-containing protein [Egibacteraceae bacterium]
MLSLTTYESVQHFFGAELRRWRERRGLSQHALGERVNFDGSLIGKVEKAERMPSRELAEACDRVLGTDGGLGRLWRLVERERERAVTGSEPGRAAGGLWLESGMACSELEVVPVLTPTVGSCSCRSTAEPCFVPAVPRWWSRPVSRGWSGRGSSGRSMRRSGSTRRS